MTKEKIVDLRQKRKAPPKIEQTKKNKMEETKLLSWQAPEFVYYEKDTKWFVGLGAIAGFLMLYFLFTKNFMVVLLFLILALVTISYALKKPPIINVAITRRGIYVAKKFYPFKHLESFHILYEPPEVKILNLKSKKSFLPYITVPLGEQNPLGVKKVLDKYLIEELDKEESFIDILARRLRF